MTQEGEIILLPILALKWYVTQGLLISACIAFIYAYMQWFRMPYIWNSTYAGAAQVEYVIN